LLLLAFFFWLEGLVRSLTARQDWVGWLAMVLFALAIFAFLMMVAREIYGLARLSALTARRQKAEVALHLKDVNAAKAVARDVRAQFADRPELRHALARLKGFDAEVLDARQVLSLAERELVTLLDREARTIVSAAARRISLVTAISPAALVDVAYVAYENFRMLRKLALLYGGRPGFFAMLRLLRMVAGHLAVTGGLALTDDFAQQLIGHGLTARLSRRLGEGVINGAFTVRIGLAALDVLRPLPHIETRPPKLRDFLAALVTRARPPRA
jgi:putative membrane protein